MYVDTRNYCPRPSSNAALVLGKNATTALMQARWDPSRKKIGDYQLQWIFDKFSESKAKGQT
eukprot:4313756-Pleurochrysis_carterae.AAC.6